MDTGPPRRAPSSTVKHGEAANTRGWKLGGVEVSWPAAYPSRSAHIFSSSPPSAGPGGGARGRGGIWGSARAFPNRQKWSICLKNFFRLWVSFKVWESQIQVTGGGGAQGAWFGLIGG